jgi:hypothetical protein
MQADYTHISFLLDGSGSMQKILDDTIGGFNSFLNSQRDGAPGRATFTLARFDDGYEPLATMMNIAYVPEMNRSNFVPRGSTRLLDSIARIISETGAGLKRLPDEARPAKVLLVILSDGEENASTEYTLDQVNAMIRHQREKYAWEFIFLGANQDAIAQACKMGMDRSKTMTYAANSIGTRGAYASLGDKVKVYRAAGATAQSLNFNATDWAVQASAGVAPPVNQNPTENSPADSKGSA